MQNLNRRLAVAVLALSLAAGNPLICAGWIPDAEARMACCLADGSCPMHAPDDAGPTRVVSQADADRCCASSEHHDGSPSSSTFVLVVSLAVVDSPVPLVMPEAATASKVWRTLAPKPGSHIATHLLLSVLLV